MPDNDLFDIKKRITAATKTRKITRTMELIASSRLQRSKILLANHQVWFRHMRQAVRCLPDSYFEPPAEVRRDAQKVYIVFGGSKGLSGAYSPNLLQYAKPVVSGQLVVAVGSATVAFFPDAHTCFTDGLPSASGARAIVQAVQAICESTGSHEVDMIYSQGTQHLTQPLFPLVRMDEYDSDMLVEPAAQLVFPALLEQYAESVVYGAQLQAFVSEQIARVSAMDSATRNADDIITDLQATYNRIRQSSITQEIITVSNAARGDE